MKKLVFLVTVVAFFVSGTIPVSAQFIVPSDFQTVEQIDALWDTTRFIENSIPKNERVINCAGGGTFRVFVGQVEGIDVRMCTVKMPDIINSQKTSIQVVINNNQRFSCPVYLSYQVFSEPKLIGDEVVVRASIGMYDESESHFYLSFKKNGDWNITSVRSKEWKTQN